MQKLCCVCTRQQFSASLDFCHQLTNPYLHQFSTIFGWNCINELTAVSPGHCMLFNSYLQKNYGRSNHQQSPTTPLFHEILAIHLPPHSLHIFHVHLHDDPHIKSQHPHNATLHLFPCGTSMKLLRDHASFPPPFKTFMLHHLETYHAWPPKIFPTPSLCSQFWLLHSPW